MSNPEPVRPVTGAIAVVSADYIKIGLEDETGPLTQDATVSAGKRLNFSKTRADGGLRVLGVHRTGEWQRQDSDVWRAPVESDPV
ncbi:hypothetical protein [Amnibacterium kyonggiense]|uniref:Uncharacterized protein n=1 Tax=Amnibacterium kyonggiense TaxID=595671 RepID=A0A4V3EBB7_9MICO|nr:hypothetical protein [Amnibacterium kyonggiense]TDS81114.1 hypothetical protein CLV52_1690 [Amnibacterium kyonggiense]